ncbi:MAG: hypothetical protein SGARI_000106 [Bacillariaceae sp.]
MSKVNPLVGASDTDGAPDIEGVADGEEDDDGANETEGCEEGADEAVGFDVGAEDGVRVDDGEEEGIAEVEVGGLVLAVGASVASRSMMFVEGCVVTTDGCVVTTDGSAVEGDEVGVSDVAFVGERDGRYVAPSMYPLSGEADGSREVGDTVSVSVKPDATSSPSIK